VQLGWNVRAIALTLIAAENRVPEGKCGSMGKLEPASVRTSRRSRLAGEAPELDSSEIDGDAARAATAINLPGLPETEARTATAQLDVQPTDDNAAGVASEGQSFPPPKSLKGRSPKGGAVVSRARKNSTRRAKKAGRPASGKQAQKRKSARATKAPPPVAPQSTTSVTTSNALDPALSPIAINIHKVSYWRGIASHLRPRRTRNEVLDQLLYFGSMFINLQSFAQGEIFGRQLERKLDEVSVQIPRGSVVCVVDVGGASRIPLMRIVAKMTPPKLGEVTLKGRVISVEQADVTPVPYKTVRHNLFSLGGLLGVSRKEMLSALPSMEAFTGSPEFFSVPVKSLPKSKLFEIALSFVCAGPFDIIIVEEVRKIFGEAWLRFLKEAPQRGKTLLISSSRLEEALDLSTHALLLDKGRLLDFGKTREVTARHAEFVKIALQTPILVSEDEPGIDDDQDDDG
jgi:ABC-type polysaccharide/polyol phosphate transport system ATPase subunit